MTTLTWYVHAALGLETGGYKIIVDHQGIEKTHGQHLGGEYHHPFGYLELTFAIHGSALPDGLNGAINQGGEKPA